MATADLITELNTDLNNAYTAIETKGGTIPENKNTNNLASAINSIEGGGDSGVPYFDGGDWGAVAYLENGKLTYYTFPDGTAWDECTQNFELISSPNPLLIAYTDANGLTHQVELRYVVAFSLGSQVTTLPTGCFRYMPLLQNIYGLDHLTSLGGDVLSYTGVFNQSLTFGETLTSIGSNFLQNSNSFNSSLSLPEELNNIGSNFLNNTSAFAQDIVIPSAVTSIGARFMSGLWDYTGIITLDTTSTPSGNTNTSLAINTPSAPSYVHGIKITGPGAAAWREKFPDLNNVSGWYRKLIVV